MNEKQQLWIMSNNGIPQFAYFDVEKGKAELNNMYTINPHLAHGSWIEINSEVWELQATTWRLTRVQIQDAN